MTETSLQNEDWNMVHITRTRFLYDIIQLNNYDSIALMAHKYIGII